MSGFLSCRQQLKSVSLEEVAKADIQNVLPPSLCHEQSAPIRVKLRARLYSITWVHMRISSSLGAARANIYHYNTQKQTKPQQFSLLIGNIQAFSFLPTGSCNILHSSTLSTT